MSNVSIYGKKWLDLVFEGKNKSYGAYQLRRDSQKNTLIAFIFGLLFTSGVFGTTLLLSSFCPKPETAAIPDSPIVIVTRYNPEKPLPPLKIAVPLSQKKMQKKPEGKTLSNPEIVKATEPVDSIIENKDLKDHANTNPDGSESGTPSTNTAPGTGNTGPGTTIIETPSNEILISAVLDKMPQFPGGIDKFYKYVGNNFKNPDIEEVRTIKILVAFVIEKDGSMTDIKVLRNPGYGLDQEAIRVLKNLKTKWTPGIMNGKPVRTAYNLPITVKME